MKIKYNLPMLNKLKDSLNNIVGKIKNTKAHERKVPFRYYTLLVLMIMIGIITFSSNAKRYSDLNTENYIKYELKDEILVSSKDIDVKTYETAISSISTSVANIEDKKLISENINECIWPVSGDVIKEYAINNLVYSKTLDMWRVHPGVDIKAELGENVYVITDGKIIEKNTDSFYGNLVKVEHLDGYVSVYANLDSIEEIEVGKKVNKGDIIGKIGVSAGGEILDESHIHFEILKDNENINPLIILE